MKKVIYIIIIIAVVLAAIFFINKSLTGFITREPVFYETLDDSGIGILNGGSFVEALEGDGYLPAENSYIEYPAQGNMDYKKGTIEFWTKFNFDPDTLPESNKWFFISGMPGWKNGIAINLWNRGDGYASVNLLLADKDGNQKSVGHIVSTGFDGADWQEGDWHHIAASWTLARGIMRFYIDGKLVQTKRLGKIDINGLPEKMYIGSHQGADAIDAVIDEFRIYDYVRSSRQIFFNYKLLSEKPKVSEILEVQKIPKIKVTRSYILPEYIAEEAKNEDGEDADYTEIALNIDVEEDNLPSGLGIQEDFPEEAKDASDEGILRQYRKQIEWLFWEKGVPIKDRTISYKAKGITSETELSGKWLTAYNEGLIECLDDDADTYSSCGYDCDDYNNKINVGTYDYPGNAEDENCDSIVICDSKARWENHGEFVSCVTQAANQLFEQGTITNKEKQEMKTEAAKSNVGKSLWQRIRGRIIG